MGIVDSSVAWIRSFTTSSAARVRPTDPASTGVQQATRTVDAPTRYTLGSVPTPSREMPVRNFSPEIPSGSGDPSRLSAPTQSRPSGAARPVVGAKDLAYGLQPDADARPRPGSTIVSVGQTGGGK